MDKEENEAVVQTRTNWGLNHSNSYENGEQEIAVKEVTLGGIWLTI